LAGQGSGTLTITSGGAAHFAANDGLRTYLGKITDLVSGYEVEQRGNLHLDVVDVKIATGDTRPIPMMKVFIPYDRIPNDFLGYLAYWGSKGEQAVS